MDTKINPFLPMAAVSDIDCNVHTHAQTRMQCDGHESKPAISMSAIVEKS